MKRHCTIMAKLFKLWTNIWAVKQTEPELKHWGLYSTRIYLWLYRDHWQIIFPVSRSYTVIYTLIAYIIADHLGPVYMIPPSQVAHLGGTCLIYGQNTLPGWSHLSAWRHVFCRKGIYACPRETFILARRDEVFIWEFFIPLRRDPGICYQDPV